MTTPPNAPHVPGSGANPPLAGRYVLIDQIGAGGMGSVWRAWDLRSRTFVAAKVLGQHDSSLLLRFVREQSVRIAHPHVVAPSGWAAEDNLVVFTMDLVAGGSVATLLGDHGPLPESYVSVVLDQTLQALEAVHAAGVVHRDVKPANLLMEPTGTGRPYVRLGDFGVAALVEDVRLTRFPGAIGTDGYMAPEQSEGAPPDPRQDLYAAGVLAVQLLTGLPPRQHDGVPPGRLAPLLTSMIDADPTRRPPSASAALAYLRGSIGVPPGAPWRSLPEPPEVFDQLGQVAPPPDPGSGAGPVTGSSVGSGTDPSGAPGSSAGRDPFPAPGAPGVNPWGPRASQVPTAAAGAAPAADSTGWRLASITCFVAAILCCLAALWLALG